MELKREQVSTAWQHAGQVCSKCAFMNRRAMVTLSFLQVVEITS